MQARQLESFDMQAIIGGWWPRGRGTLDEIGRVVSLDDVHQTGIGAYVLAFRTVGAEGSVKVIRFRPESGYPLNARNARAAGLALQRLAEHPTDQNIADFVSRFGPLLNFGEWVSRIQMHRMTTVKGRRLIGPLHWDTRYEGSVHYGSDALQFAEWCDETGDHEAAAYVRWAWRVVPQCPELGPGVFPEPVSFYVWAAGQLARLRRDLELQREDRSKNRPIRPLSESARTWLVSRLDDTRLHLSEQPGKLVMRATSLLAYLTAITYLEVFTETNAWRACGHCGNDFQPDRGQQRYCASSCREAAQKQRHRQRPRGSM